MASSRWKNTAGVISAIWRRHVGQGGSKGETGGAAKS
jgi:hypothetical protein